MTQMPHLTRLATAAWLLAAAPAAAQTAPASTDTQASRAVQAFNFFIGCWRGHFEGGRPEIFEERCVTPTLNGQYVRDIHYTRGTSYWGEFLAGYDPSEGSLSYTYFDANGGRSTGPVRAADGILTFPDDRHVGSDGRVMILRTTWRPVSSDTYVAETMRQVAGGEWTLFMRVTYNRTSDFTRVGPRPGDGSS